MDNLHRNGLAPGVLNLVMGKGSVGTGRRVAKAGARQMRGSQIEMGGKNPLVVLDDADLAVAVDVALNGSFYSTGQRCTASSRLIVTEGIHDRFVSALAERMTALQVGQAMDPATQIGPVVDEGRLTQNPDYIAAGIAEGARLFGGGALIDRPTKGHFLSPALFVDCTPAMRIMREEIFGPVAGIIRVRNYEQALDVANGTEFGLSAGICTTSLKHATHFRRNAEAGMVMVNLPTAGVDFHVPFGGRKASSFGPREQGRYAAEFFTAIKTSYKSGG